MSSWIVRTQYIRNIIYQIWCTFPQFFIFLFFFQILKYIRRNINKRKHANPAAFQRKQILFYSEFIDISLWYVYTYIYTYIQVYIFNIIFLICFYSNMWIYFHVNEYKYISTFNRIINFDYLPNLFNQTLFAKYLVFILQFDNSKCMHIFISNCFITVQFLKFDLQDQN